MIARRIKPIMAIITDVTHDSTTPMISKNIEGIAPVVKVLLFAMDRQFHNKLLDLVQDVASGKIPVQLRCQPKRHGTDTDSFAYANDGCPSVLDIYSVCYMHTTVEMLHKKDIENHTTDVKRTDF